MIADVVSNGSGFTGVQPLLEHILKIGVDLVLYPIGDVNILTPLIAQMSLPSFADYIKLLNTLESVVDKPTYIEDVLEAMTSAGIGVASITTSDIGGVVLPLGTLARRRPIDEDALKGSKEAQAFLSKNIRRYKAIWKDAGEMVAKSVAEHLYLNNFVAHC